MKVIIGHASIDENGEITGGQIGDQTGKEICIRDWYEHKHGWSVYLECTDETIAKEAAEYMKQICADSNFGYDQSQRTTGYISIIQNGKKVKGAKGGFDCSSSVSACYNLAGITSLSVNNTTRTLRKALLKTGLFVEYTDSGHLMSGKLSKIGGVYLSEGNHVVMIVDIKKDKPANPFAVPTSDVEFGDTSSTSVKWVQWELNAAGWNLKNDGDFGSKTDKAVKEYQTKYGLKVDGVVGPKTREHMINN